MDGGNRVEVEGPRRRFKRVGSATVLGLAVVCGALLWWAETRGRTAAKFERSIRAEVPRMCSRPVVEEWFDRHGMWHEWSVNTRVVDIGGQTPAELAGLRDADLGGVCWTALETPEVNVGLGNSGEIGIYFFFDDRGRCLGHYVDEWVSSP